MILWAFALAYLLLAVWAYARSGLLPVFWRNLIQQVLPEAVREAMRAHPVSKWSGPVRPVGILASSIFGLMLWLLIALVSLLGFLVISPLVIRRMIRDLIRKGDPPRPGPAPLTKAARL